MIELREVYNANLPKITQYYTEISQHQALFQKFKALRSSSGFERLTPAQIARIRFLAHGFGEEIALREIAPLAYQEAQLLLRLHPFCDDLEVECHLHGSRFNVVDGSVRILPATKPVATYPVKVEGDVILVGPRNEN